jgi:hypothetical protein
MRGGQAFAPLCATPLQDESPVLGRHPRAKSVRLCAPAIVGLKSAFRHSCLFSTQKKRVRLTVRAVSVKKPRPDSAPLNHFSRFEIIRVSARSVQSECPKIVLYSDIAGKSLVGRPTQNNTFCHSEKNFRSLWISLASGFVLC